MSRVAACRDCRPTASRSASRSAVIRFGSRRRGPARFELNATPACLDAVRELAAEDGVRPAESELIGLAPLAAFLAVADYAGAPAEDPIETRLAAAASYLRLRDYSPMQILDFGSRRRKAAAGRPALRATGPDPHERWAVPCHRGRPHGRPDARAPDRRCERDRDPRGWRASWREPG